MKRYFLLIDFGASHIKSSLVDLVSGDFVFPYVCASLGNIATQPFHYEMSAMDLRNQFFDVCQYYAKQDIPIEGIVLCSQMHGFILLDENNNPFTHYISWRDERSLEKIQGRSSIDILNESIPQFKHITGMRLCAGLPIANLLHLGRLREDVYGKKIKLITLPEWIALNGTESYPYVHQTMLASTGFFDIRTGSISPVLTDFIKHQTGIELSFNTIASEREVSGLIPYLGKLIPIYTGVGDHQCALLGAGNDDSSISINIGTGSQLSKIVTILPPDPIEARPYFNHQFLLTHTHIPAGRALNEYIGFLESIMVWMTDKKINIWEKLTELTVEDILRSTLEIDLAVFQGAATYSGGGKITQIKEGHLTAKNYVASLLHHLLRQYVHLIKERQWQEGTKLYILSGGIPRKLPILRDVLACLLENQVLASANIDETLLGLRHIIQNS